MTADQPKPSGFDVVPDFGRPVHCVLGMPLDKLSLDEAVREVRRRAMAREPLFFSTPNLSYVAAVQSNPVLRDSVLQSAMSVPDGMPLVWAAKMMGVKQPGRVAGSTMFDRIWRSPEPGDEAVKVYFFGGQDGVAAKACEALNADKQGAVCVGFDSPGFGTVEEMSEERFLAPIRDSGAELLVVSIGVAKGQAWILRNRRLLQVPAIAYLGAVVNFVAGTVRRAPVWMRRVGLEWLWRVKEEPSLWRRYWTDAWTYGRLLLTRVLPYRLSQRFRAPTAEQLARARVELGRDDGGEMVLKIDGAWTGRSSSALRSALAEAAAVEGSLRVDLTGCAFVDAEIVALLGLLWGHRNASEWPCSVHTGSATVRRVIHYCCADYLLTAAGDQ